MQVLRFFRELGVWKEPKVTRFSLALADWFRMTDVLIARGGERNSRQAVAKAGMEAPVSTKPGSEF